MALGMGTLLGAPAAVGLSSYFTLSAFLPIGFIPAGPCLILQSPVHYLSSHKVSPDLPVPTFQMSITPSTTPLHPTSCNLFPLPGIFYPFSQL